MCNAWNHPPGCACGWGGEGHLGRRGSAWDYTFTPPAPRRSTWEYKDEDFCKQSSCPMCGARVYFVRHNGGSVWFDELGPPWPKHGCFDDDDVGALLRNNLITESIPEAPAVFGVVIETVATAAGESGRIVVRCSDGRIIDAHFQTSLDLEELVGQIFMVHGSEPAKISLTPISDTGDD